MFRAPPRPSSGAYNCINSLWSYRWSVVIAVLLVVVWPDHDQQRCYHHAPMVKPEAVNAVVSSWRWAWRHTKTRSATRKRQVINLWNCWILLVNLFDLDYYIPMPFSPSGSSSIRPCYCIPVLLPWIMLYGVCIVSATHHHKKRVISLVYRFE